MPKSRRVEVDRTDPFRVILTETLPVEVPIIFSNDGFYHWLKEHLPKLQRPTSPLSQSKKAVLDLIESLVIPHPNGKQSEIAIKYDIALGGRRTRQMSLVHPRAQRRWVDFYSKYHKLLVHYCSRSPWSLRAPCRLASQVFIPNTEADRNIHRLTSQDVDHEKEDLWTKHPGSFFAYRGVGRFYQFFDSDALLHLESKFSTMWMLDISKCFGSIYTHSISWATRSKRSVKDDIPGSGHTFGGQFDDHMQRCNWKETNGIVVGPEVSRLFAEVILQDVDIKTMRELQRRSMGDDVFAVRRYVDDYVVFARGEREAEIVVNELASQLSEYGLVFNEQKTTKLNRPFLTPRSSTLMAVRRIVNDLQHELTEVTSAKDGEVQGAPKDMVAAEKGTDTTANSPDTLSAEHPRNPPAMVGVVPRKLGRGAILKLARVKQNFIRAIKSVTAGLQSDYDLVALYVLSALDRIVVEMCGVDMVAPTKDRDYQLTFSLLIDLVYFFYSVQPTVPASFRVANTSLLTVEFCRKRGLNDLLPDIEKSIFDGCAAFLSNRRGSGGEHDGASIEALNIVSVLGQLEQSVLPWRVLRDWVFGEARGGKPSDPSYFQIVVCLRYANAKREYPEYVEAIAWLGEVINEQVKKATRKEMEQEAHLAHLVLDSLACPFLQIASKRSILREVRSKLGLSPVGVDADADAVLGFLRDRPWFTNWGEVDLFRALERKQRTSVY